MSEATQLSERASGEATRSPGEPSRETTTPAPGVGPREKAPRWMLVVAAIGALYFIWLMVQSGFDLRVRAHVTELVKLAETQPKAVPTHPYVAQSTVDPNGAVRLRLKGEPALEGKSLALVPERVDGKVVGWRCTSDAPRQFLPRHCND